MDITVVDASEDFQSGYMTKQLRGLHVTHQNHLQHMRAFAEHSGNDRWSSGHPAQHLPKDGYTFYGISGFCRLAAARLEGLPASSYSWQRGPRAGAVHVSTTLGEKISMAVHNDSTEFFWQGRTWQSLAIFFCILIRSVQCL